MKKILLKFADNVLSKNELRTVRGGHGEPNKCGQCIGFNNTVYNCDNGNWAVKYSTCPTNKPIKRMWLELLSLKCRNNLGLSSTKVKTLTLLLLFISFSAVAETTIKVTRSSGLLGKVSLCNLEFLGPPNVVQEKEMSGNKEVNFTLTIPTTSIYYISYNKKYWYFLLKPNGNYAIEILDTDENQFALYKGDDALLHNQHQLERQYFANFKYNDKLYYEWDGHEVIEGYKLLETSLKQERDSFLKANFIQGSTAKLYTSLLELDIKSVYLQAILSRRKEVKNFSTDNLHIKNLLSWFEENQHLMEYNTQNYMVGLQSYVMINKAFIIEKEGVSTPPANVQINLMVDEIKKYPFSKVIKEFMFANLLQNAQRFLESAFLSEKLQLFDQEFPNSKYRPYIKNYIVNKEGIKKGEIAPPIKAYTEKNEVWKNSDNVGKVLYIDIWATWCGPCIKEFPHFLNLQKHYKENPEIEFISISVDEDKEKWYKYVAENLENHRAIHLIFGEDTKNGILKSYNNTSVPQYIIIDKLGNLIDADAPRPADPKLKALLDEVLKKE